MKQTLPADQEVLLRLPQVIQIRGQGRSTIYKDIAAGTFPKPVQLSTQSVAWRKSDIDRWISERPFADPKGVKSTQAERRRAGRSGR